MPRNKLSDLNNHLFEELERLNDESLEGDALANEIKRSDAMVSIASAIINNAEVGIKAAKLACEYGKAAVVLPDAIKNDVLQISDRTADKKS